jgi:hypothetical protein
MISGMFISVSSLTSTLSPNIVFHSLKPPFSVKKLIICLCH